MKQAEKLKRYFEANEFFVTKAQGTSMLPMIKGGQDTLIIQRASDMSPLKKGDILLYEEPQTGKLVLHRLLKFGSNSLVINGDNLVSWEYYPREAILGKLVQYETLKGEKALEGFSYKLYLYLWVYNWPLRFTSIKVKRKLKKWFRKLKS